MRRITIMGDDRCKAMLPHKGDECCVVSNREYMLTLGLLLERIFGAHRPQAMPISKQRACYAQDHGQS